MRRWWPLGVLALAQIGYPLTRGHHRATLVIVTVLLGFAFSVAHAVRTRGGRAGAALVAVTAVGGLAVEMLGVHSGFPFGGYRYSQALGPRVFGVPAVIPLAWTWMAWPAWLAAGAVTQRRAARVALAALGLAAWDLFLDPQMVAAGYWHWRHPAPHLPGVPGVPLTNHLGWLGVAVLMMALLAAVDATPVEPRRDAPMLALYLWTYLSSVLALAAFLGQPAVAGWGALGMGLVALPTARAMVPR
jgi:carotene biosynthesis associated membrane protein